MISAYHGWMKFERREVNETNYLYSTMHYNDEWGCGFCRNKI